MTKRDLVVRIARDTGLTQLDVGKIIQKTLDYITESLERRENVELRDFGVFKVKRRGARKGRNPNKPEIEVQIPARNVVVFKSGKRMKDLVESELS